MKHKIISWTLFVLSILVLWQIMSLSISNPFILPYPLDVLKAMVDLAQHSLFYKAIGITFLRVFISVCLSFVFAILLSYASLYNKWVRAWIDKAMVVIRTVPNVVFIVLFLFWFSRETVTFLVSFFLLCPIIYENTYRVLKNVEQEWQDILRMFPQPFLTKVKYVHFPLLNTSIISSLVVASSMGFKVGIMAEILGQVSKGIGRQIQLAKLDVNITVVLAWTIWIILFVLIINAILNRLEKRTI